MLAYPSSNQAFLEALFGAQWPRCHVAAFYGNPQDPKLPRGYWAGGKAIDQLDTFKPDQNTYFSLSLFTESDRLLINWEKLVVLGVDDVGTKVLEADVRNLMGEPDYRLETSPGNFQWGYRLTQPLTHGDSAVALQRALKNTLVGEDEPDPGMNGLNRYFRLPYGANGKPAALTKDGRPCPCVLRGWMEG